MTCCWRQLAMSSVLASTACGPEVATEEPPRVLVDRFVDGSEQIWLFDAADASTTRIDPPSATAGARSICGVAAHADRFCVRTGQGQDDRVVLVDARSELAPIDVTAVHHGAHLSSPFFAGDDALVHAVDGDVYELDVAEGGARLRRLLSPPSSTAWIWSEVRVSPAGTWIAAPISTGLHGHSWDLLLARRSDARATLVELGAVPGTNIVSPQLPEFAADEQAVFAVASSDAQATAVVVTLVDGPQLRTLALPAGFVVQRMAPAGDLMAWGVDGDVFVLPARDGARGQPRRLTTGGRADAFELAADGRWVLVQSFAQQTCAHVSVVEVGTAAAFELHDCATTARFSADGSALLLDAPAGPELVDLAGPKPVAAAIIGFPFDEAEIAPDGESVAIVRGRTLAVVTRDGVTHDVFTAAEGSRPYAPRFSAGGAWLSWEQMRQTPEGFVEPAGVWVAAWGRGAPPIAIDEARRRLALLDPL